MSGRKVWKKRGRKEISLNDQTRTFSRQRLISTAAPEGLEQGKSAARGLETPASRSSEPIKRHETQEPLKEGK